MPHRFQIRSRYDLGAADTAGAVELINTEPAQLPGIVQRLDANPEVAVEYLSPLLSANASTPEDKRALLHGRLATVARDPSPVEPLAEELLTGKVTYVIPIRQILRPYSQ